LGWGVTVNPKGRAGMCREGPCLSTQDVTAGSACRPIKKGNGKAFRRTQDARPWGIRKRGGWKGVFGAGVRHWTSKKGTGMERSRVKSKSGRKKEQKKQENHNQEGKKIPCKKT